METTLVETTHDDAGCAHAGAASAAAELASTDRLFVPHRKRLFHTYVVNEQGARELRIDYGVKEITFDDERFFAFGERLATEASFTGQLATTWGPGYAWDELQPLLEALLEEGILERGDGAHDPRGGGLVPSLVPASDCPVPRAWSLAECEAITRELAGRAVEIGHLEACVPAFRIAHPALDADDRQVGEANVYPSRLRLDRPTEWRVCQYAGSRYRDRAPMNVTALRAMIKHWKPIMAVVFAVRGELRARLGPPQGAWTIGELYVLSCVILALPAFQLMRRGGSRSRPLHPVLSSLYRITDGVRMTTDDLLFSIEDPHPADEPITAAGIYARAEQRGLLIGDTGVCAGPRHMIDEFLAAIVEGAVPEGVTGLELPAEVAELMAELPPAIDYGLSGLQVWGTSLPVWVAMSRAYQALLAILEAEAEVETGPAAPDACAARLLGRLGADWAVLERVQVTSDHGRGVHLAAYVSGYERSWRATRAPVGRPVHAEEIAPVPETAAHRAAASRLRDLLGARWSCARGDDGRTVPPAVAQIADTVVDYIRAEQAVLAATSAHLEAINALLDRPRARRPLQVADLRLFYTLGRGSVFPYLFDALEDELGIRVECTASAIDVIDRRST